MGFINYTTRSVSSCAICRDEIPARTTAARWNNRNRPVCQACVPALPILSSCTESGPVEAVGRASFVTGQPGRSCQQKVHVTDLTTMVEMAGRGVRSLDARQLRFAADWQDGATSESASGKAIDDEISETFGVALHDRQLNQGNIDHIVITNHGIAVVDTRTARGTVRRLTQRSLYVGDVNYSRKIDQAAHLASQVRDAIGQWADDIEIAPMLCLLEPDWASTSPPFEVDSVSIVPVGRVVQRLAHRAKGSNRWSMNDDLVLFLGLELATKFPAA
jgi:Nuclease-related domain